MELTELRYVISRDDDENLTRDQLQYLSDNYTTDELSKLMPIIMLKIDSNPSEVVAEYFGFPVIENTIPSKINRELYTDQCIDVLRYKTKRVKNTLHNVEKYVQKVCQNERYAYLNEIDAYYRIPFIMEQLCFHYYDSCKRPIVLEILSHILISKSDLEKHIPLRILKEQKWKKPDRHGVVDRQVPFPERRILCKRAI